MPDRKSIDRKSKRVLRREKYQREILSENLEVISSFGKILLINQEKIQKQGSLNFAEESIRQLNLDQGTIDSLCILMGKIPEGLINRIEMGKYLRLVLDAKRKPHCEVFHYLYFGYDLEESVELVQFLETQKKYKKINETMAYAIFVEPDYGW